MRLGVDLDGVIASYGEHPHDTRTYPWWEPSTYLEREPVLGAVEAMADLTAQGHELFIITARGLHDNTHIWLNQHGFGQYPVTHTQNKWLVPCHAYLDDGPTFLRDLYSRRCTTVKWLYPHNADVKSDHVVSSWADFVALVESGELKGKLRTMPRVRRKVK